MAEGCTGVFADAPGKLLLLGEYAVLAGAPALVMAVDRRVQVRLETVGDGAAWVRARQLGLDEEPLHWSAAGPQGGPALERLGMTARLLPLLAGECAIQPQRLNRIGIEIDSAALFAEDDAHSASGSPVKLGLGSSGAVTAALACAFELLSGEAGGSASERWARWLPHYLAALGSEGSGADLAASLAGGMQLLRPGHDAASGLQRRTWPQGMYWRALWVGTPAQTLDYVATFRAWIERDTGPAARVLAEMTATVESLAATRDAQVWMECFDAYGALLERLGAAMGRPILTEAHLQLRALAQRHGLVYKSCGAGGGDLGVALSTDPERLDAFCSAAWSNAAHPLNLNLDSRGASARSTGSALADSASIA